MSLTVPDQVERLLADIHRWRHELALEQIRRTTLLGIATDTVDRFEVCLRDLLARYLDYSAISYEAHRSDAETKPLPRLTIGEVLGCFDVLNKPLTDYLRSQATDALKYRRLITPKERNRLSKIVTMRDEIHHRSSEFAPDEATLISNAAILLEKVESALKSPLFTLANVGSLA